MGEIKVIISGLILLVSSNAFIQGGNDTIRSAVVANASRPFDSSYDVDIPIHEALLSIDPNDIISVTGPNRFENAPGGEKQLRLTGDHVQFGTGKLNCQPFALSAMVVPNDSTRTIPRLSNIISSDVALAPGTFPTGANNDDYSAMNTALVSAWLDINGGRLRVLRTDEDNDGVPDNDEVEFRPSRARANLASSVEWNAGEADCMIVTPFSGTNPMTVVLKSGATIIFRNTAIDNSGEVIPGAGYDYEILYTLVKDSPSVPPIPYAIGARTGKDGHVHGGTGVNCGPPKIR